MERAVRRCGTRACAFVLIFALLLVSCYALWDGIVWPQASGSTRKSDASLTVDMSGAEYGYIMCKAKAGKSRYKLRITCGSEQFTYDLNKDGEYEIFPLQSGSGTYKVSLYKNKSGKKYSAAGELKIKVSLDREDAAFLVPNQYVNYTADTSVVAKSEELCKGLTSDRDKFEAIRKWISTYFLYDYVKAVTVSTGTMPDIEGTWKTGMGICQDFAAIAACMLRVQGIPCEFVVGYRGKDYHAWNEVRLDGESLLYDPTAEISGGSSKAKYSVERYY